VASRSNTDQTHTRPSADATASSQVFVVGIGTSAGGLEALRTLLGSLATDSGIAFVVAAHRSPQHESRLAELLQPYTALPVREMHGTAPLEAGCVYVIPATAGVAAVDSHIRLVPLAAGSGQLGSINRLFRALAASHGSRSIGVQLTGAGSDGALGLRQLKHAEGLVIVQDPNEAEYDGMPRSAIESGVADLVLPLREIGGAIERYCGAAPRLSLPERHDDSLSEDDGAQLREVVALLQVRTGRDFAVYAPHMLIQRVIKRMRVRSMETIPEYLRLLEAEVDESTALASEVALNVTEFFADEDASRRLERDILPQLFERKNGHGAIRAWCVGCATGEEAYSLAMQLVEQRTSRKASLRLQVFAGDADEALLQRARLGVYPPEIAASVSEARLATFFVRDERGYRVRPELRRTVTFARHDVFTDFPFSHLDLIVCRRRMLRNLTPAARRAVLQSFQFALEPHGVLIVSQEDAFDEPRLFVSIGDGAPVYRRVDVSRAALRVPAVGADAWSAARHPRSKPPSPDPRVLHAQMLERYMPASFLVNAHGHVMDYSAHAGHFVRLRGGEIRHELSGIVPEPLSSVVAVGLEAVTRHASPWVSDAIVVHTPGGARRVAVHVDPVGGEEQVEGAKLVVFEELGRGRDARYAEGQVDPVEVTARLDSELGHASQRLKSIAARTQDRDAPSVPPDDGELARIVEDLEMAKEELQTVNQELFALNQENRSRLEDLARLSTDLEVLLESTGVATLFLDNELKVVRFTPPLLDIFNVLPADLGRPLADLRHRLRDQDLVGDARRVLKHLTPMDREVEGENGKWYLLRMLPYRAPPQPIAGVAVSLIDITTRKRAEQRLREADRRKDEFIALLAHELRNPLAPISSGIEILRRRDLDPAIAERVTATMARQATQLVRLIDDLLDVSRISSGRLRLRKGPVVVADIVRDAVATVRPLIERSGHELVVALPNEPIVLDGDAARLTQVLANLLNNSARYTAGNGRIELGVVRDADSVVIAVKDNGYGIAETALPHVFEMFYQGSDPRAAPQAGLGIGLALAKSLIEMHGGTIEVVSAGLDRGSAFAVRLPANVQRDMPEPSDAHLAGTALGGHRVLVVDDNADAAQTLAYLIRALGENEVHVALSGAEALPLAERVKPDTVFLDLKMPEMDGYEVARRMRAEAWANDVWFVALTGWGLEEHKRRTTEAGFDQHLTKPADRAALEGILARSNGARIH
jgi:two-component system, chemotaxis family, CheB/CheR fusion protein